MKEAGADITLPPPPPPQQQQQQHEQHEAPPAPLALDSERMFDPAFAHPLPPLAFWQAGRLCIAEVALLLLEANPVCLAA